MKNFNNNFNNKMRSFKVFKKKWKYQEQFKSNNKIKLNNNKKNFKNNYKKFNIKWMKWMMMVNKKIN